MTRELQDLTPRVSLDSSVTAICNAAGITYLGQEIASGFHGWGTEAWIVFSLVITISAFRSILLPLFYWWQQDYAFGGIGINNAPIIVLAIVATAIFVVGFFVVGRANVAIAPEPVVIEDSAGHVQFIGIPVEESSQVQDGSDNPAPSGQTIEPADRERILAVALFQADIDELYLGLADYETVASWARDPDACDTYWRGHSGWHVQTRSVAQELTADVDFYSLTSGIVIRAQDGVGHGVIAVYDGEADKTTIYMPARQAHVVEGQQVRVGTKLGVQGGWPDLYGTQYEHVHVEVRDGKKDWMACGAGAADSEDPIGEPYLIDSVSGAIRHE